MILVPISIEKSFSSIKEILLLGDWCINSYTSAIPKKNILSYHWTDKNKLDKDVKYIEDLYEKLLPKYTKVLNKYHHTSHSEMFWRIVCGFWLKSFITVAYDRWFMAELAFSSYNIEEIALLDVDSYSLIPKNIVDYGNLCRNSDEWNSYIFHEIFVRLNDLKIHKFNIKNTKKTKSKLNILKNIIKSKTNRILSRLAFFLSKKNEVIFVDSYLPIKEQWRIENRLNQSPSFFKFNEIIGSNSININRREELNITYNPKNDFEIFLISIISKQMPISYLEDFKNLIEKFNKFPSYLSVKVVFTANAHLINDQFTIWAAHAKEAGAKLIIGQHGGGTRSLKHDSYLSHEYSICDHYIAWGEGGKYHKKNIVLPVNKFSEYIPKSTSSKNGLLHVLGFNHKYITHIDSNLTLSKYQNYIKDQKFFIDLIDSKSSKGYKLRANPNSINAGWSNEFDIVGNYSIDNEKHFIKSLKNNKLIVATCNQTTFLQSLAMNIPTVVFWNSEYELLEDSVISDYKKLYDIGILFDSPEAAAKHINELWNNIDIWWNAPELQTIRREFCNKYMYTTNNKDRVLQWSVFFNQLL
jgi:putative transferase (TIGR04331 family)